MLRSLFNPLRSAQASSSRLMSTATKNSRSLLPSRETPSPVDLLTLIGRNSDKRIKAETWDDLDKVWKSGGPGLKELGMGVKERRYTLWALSKYSLGLEPSTFIRAPAPAKKFRGWGPRVQHGVRVK